jgi:ribosomal protein S18 acetylase RimI-like enzyme
MSLRIRPAENSDVPYLYDICLKTADSGKDASALFRDPYLVGQYYAAPYVFFNPELCFIAENDFIPEGYIIATADTIRFNAWLETKWLPPLRSRYLRMNSLQINLPESQHVKQAQSQKELHIINRIHANHVTIEDPQTIALQEMYPAHLHIDLLPSIQGKGFGRILMETLFEKLKEINCPGIQLGVDGTNLNAIGFYKKIGFSVLEEKNWGLNMGKKLHE